METTRRVISTIFFILVICGLIFLMVLLVGGAFPISLGMGDQTVKFDLARIGWDPLNPADTFTIVHEDKFKKKGWGSLQFDYTYKEGKRPGIHSESYPIEGFYNISLYMKAKKPCVWQMRLKRKTDKKIFIFSFKVGKEWKKYTVSVYELKKTTKYKGKFDRLDFRKWIEFVDITPRKKTGERNTVWFDDIRIAR